MKKQVEKRDAAEAAGAQARTRKSAATRERIMAAATELMLEHGGTGFQIGEVSERCGMSKGSLYYYFADKGALVQAIFDRSMDRLVADVEAAVAHAPSASASILGLVEAVARAVRPGSALTLALAHGIWDVEHEVLPHIKEHLDCIIAVLEAQLERAKGEGIVRPGANSHLVAVAIIGAFAITEYAGEVVDENDDPEAFVHGVLDVVFHGIGADGQCTLRVAR